VAFTIDEHSTNPETSKALLRADLIALLSRRATGQYSRPYTVSVPIPVLDQEELIQIGFLTAAYLLWFRELGYSWALQRHLEPIREQIRNPTRQVLPRMFSAVCREYMLVLILPSIACLPEQLLSRGTTAEKRCSGVTKRAAPLRHPDRHRHCPTGTTTAGVYA
jgi:hypothetical protein